MVKNNCWLSKMVFSVMDFSVYYFKKIGNISNIQEGMIIV